MQSNIEKAYKICLADLRSCQKGEGILASPLNFSDYWTRDTFWTTLGILNSNIPQKTERVRDSLELFLKYQRPDGKIPRKIALDYNGLKYLGIKIKRKKPRPIYFSPIGFLFSMDENLLLAIAFCLYIDKTQDFEFAKIYFGSVSKSLAFYTKRNLTSQKMIREAGLGNWMDTIFKKGHVLYTNCLWHKAVKQIENLAAKTGMEKDLMDLPSSQEIRENILSNFWISKKQYFADNLPRAGKQSTCFDLAGNLLAILFDIADTEQSDEIFKKIEATKRKGDKLHRINDPLYPFWKVNPVASLFGIGRYHNGISWSWLEALLIITQLKTGRIAQAKNNLENFSAIIISNNHIHETYFLDGRPFDHLLWKSAVPFAWGAGMFLWAIALYKNSLLHDTGR